MIIVRAWQLQVPVTPWNVSELRDYVINGPAIHPGHNSQLACHWKEFKNEKMPELALQHL